MQKENKNHAIPQFGKIPHETSVPTRSIANTAIHHAEKSPLFLLPAARAPGERQTEDDVRQDPFGKVTELHPQGAIGGIRIAPSGCSEDIGPTSVPGSDQLKLDSEWLGHTNGALRKPGEA